MRNKAAPALFLLAGLAPAAAHVTLTEPSAKPGTAYVAHFRVGHGCSGSPTIALSITIPEVVAGVKPQPVPGWTVQTEQAAGRVKSVTWSGGSLAADRPGEFAIAMTLPSTSGALAFPATQTCEKSVVQWSELPAADGHTLKNPAPILTVSPIPAKTPEPAMAGMKM